MPTQQAGLRIKRDHGTRIEIITSASFSPGHRHGVAGTIVDEAQLGVRGSLRPDRSSAPAQCARVIRPRGGRRIIRPRYDIEAPENLPALGVYSHDFASCPAIATAQAAGDDPLHVGWCIGNYSDGGVHVE